MTGRSYFIINVGVAASAGVGGEAIFRAGRVGNYFFIVVAGRRYSVTRVGVTAFAGKGGVTVFRAGRLGNAFSILVFVGEFGVRFFLTAANTNAVFIHVTGSRRFVTRVGMTASTGVGGVTAS